MPYNAGLSSEMQLIDFVSPMTCFLAVDVGNARTKLGLFTGDCAQGLPEPRSTLALSEDAAELDRIVPWMNGFTETQMPSPLFPLPQAGEGNKMPSPPSSFPKGEERGLFSWWIASVNRPAATTLVEWIRSHRPSDGVVMLASGDLPLEVRVERPDMVGIDRLVDAVAANRLRAAGRSAIIVDVGSAITVDLVSGDGAFLGGAILPGIEMAARAMHHFTDLLPLVKTSELAEPPSALGTSTVSAMRSGLFWGAVGAIRQLVERLGETAGGQPDVFLTGGAGAAVAALLGGKTRLVPNLTLAGIALAAMGQLEMLRQVRNT